MPPGSVCLPVLTDSGSGWTPATTPSLSVADPSSSLTGVSCAAPGSCVAVGTDAAGVLTLRSLAGWCPVVAHVPGQIAGAGLAGISASHWSCQLELSHGADESSSRWAIAMD
jgi:hypothetical protein